MENNENKGGKKICQENNSWRRTDMTMSMAQKMDSKTENVTI